MRRVDSNNDQPADPQSQQRSSSADQHGAERKDSKEVYNEQRYAADLAAVAKEQRAEARRIREMHGGAVAFEVRLDASEEPLSANPSHPGPHDPPHVDDFLKKDDSEPRHVGMRSNSEADEYARGLRVVTAAMQGRSRQASREDSASDPNEGTQRRRRSWGAPVDLNDIRRNNQPKDGDREANGENYKGIYSLHCQYSR